MSYFSYVFVLLVVVVFFFNESFIKTHLKRGAGEGDYCPGANLMRGEMSF